MNWRARSTSPRLMRRLAISAIVANAGIVVTGGAVRLSNSGLGCPDWPRCTDGRLVPGGRNTHTLLHQSIEFSNRLLTFLVFATAVACVLGAWRLRPRRPGVLAIAWILPAGIVFQALLGGLTVLDKLNPLVVAAHFLPSMVLCYIAAWLYARVVEGDGPPQRVVRREIQLGVRLLVAVVGAVEVVGTLVTATGPHAGDPHTRRLDWDPKMVTQFHADLVFLYVGLILALILGMKATRAPALVLRRSYVLVAVIVFQATIGYVQYFTHVPAVLVGIHMFGATLGTIATARLFFVTRERLDPQPAADTPAAATQAALSDRS